MRPNTQCPGNSRSETRGNKPHHTSTSIIKHHVVRSGMSRPVGTVMGDSYSSRVPQILRACRSRLQPLSLRIKTPAGARLARSKVIQRIVSLKLAIYRGVSLFSIVVSCYFLNGVLNLSEVKHLRVVKLTSVEGRVPLEAAPVTYRYTDRHGNSSVSKLFVYKKSVHCNQYLYKDATDLMKRANNTRRSALRARRDLCARLP